ncbi:MAG: GIN domain-containing protein [Luteibaculum sp.]
MRLLLGLLLSMSLLFSCGKEENCFQSAGEKVNTSIALPPFTGIVLQDNIHLEVTDSPQYSVELSYFKNLVDGIDFSIEDSILFLDNRNKCRWLKSADKPKLRIEMPLSQLRSFKHLGTEDLKITGDISSEEFLFEMRDNAAEVHFKFTGNNLYIAQHTGSNKLVVEGNANYLALFNAGQGLSEFSRLRTSFVDVSNVSVARIWVHPTDQLIVKNYGLGEVNYCPDVANKQVENFGGGKISACLAQ